MAINVQGGILEQTDVRETITNTEETGVLFNLNFARYVAQINTAKNITGLHVSPTGLKLYITYDEAGASTVAEWTMATKWDITTATETNTKDVDAQNQQMEGVALSIDGTKMYLCGNFGAGVSRIYEYDLGTAWDISTAVYNAVSLVRGDFECSGIYFREDGKQMFHGSANNTHIYNVVLTTAWSLATAVQITADLTGGTNTDDVYFSRDGLKVFTVNNDEFVDVYTLTIPFLVSSKGTVTAHKIVPIKDLHGIAFNTAGSLMYTGAFDGGVIIQYALKRGWK